MMDEKLYQSWSTPLASFANDPTLLHTLFNEILNCYSESHRCYHTLNHIRHLLELSREYSNLLTTPDIVQLSIFYHDVIYKIHRSDNEKKSAQKAEEQLIKLNFPKEKIELVKLFINCTKNHEPVACAARKDLEYFLDFDLSVLGAPKKEYNDYVKAIRKEYGMYPDFIYNRGRKKVLLHFINKKNIFLTSDFKARYEQQALENLKNELTIL